MIGLYKIKAIRKRGPWRGIDVVEYATLEWFDWYNRMRLLEPLGYMPQPEYENHYYQRQVASSETAQLN